MLSQEVDVGDVVQIDDGVHLAGKFIFLRLGLVGGEHDLVALEAHRVRQHQLRDGRAVHAAALLLQELEDVGVGAGLDREVLAEAGIPGEGIVHGLRGCADARLVVEVEGRGVFRNDFVELVQIHEGLLLHICHQFCIFMRSY